VNTPDAKPDTSNVISSSLSAEKQQSENAKKTTAVKNALLASLKKFEKAKPPKEAIPSPNSALNERHQRLFGDTAFLDVCAWKQGQFGGSEDERLWLKGGAYFDDYPLTEMIPGRFSVTRRIKRDEPIRKPHPPSQHSHKHGKMSMGAIVDGDGPKSDRAKPSKHLDSRISGTQSRQRFRRAASIKRLGGRHLYEDEDGE
jgi:hypothetical protein